MRKDAVILVVETNDGHYRIIQKNLLRGGITNEMLRFDSGAELLKFLNLQSEGRVREDNMEYLMLIDISHAEEDALDVLRTIKDDNELGRIPVIAFTDSNSPDQVIGLHKHGSSMCVQKPDEYEEFVDTIKKIGMFLSIVEMPVIKVTHNKEGVKK